ncbi:MAG TPA: YfhO family protein, partial [Bryobacteraceae bacterium]
KDELAKTGDMYVEALSMRPAAKFIEDQPGLKRVSVRLDVDHQPNVGDIFGLQWIWGGGATVLKDYSHLFPREDLMNVRYRIEPSSTPDPGAVYQDSLWKVYENRKAFPRAWIVHQTVVASSDEAAVALAERTSTDLHKVGIVETPLSFPGGGIANDSVSFQEYQAGAMKLRARTSSPGMLILSEVYYPGWRAVVNGKPIPVIRVDGGIRGIPLASGESRVEMEYVPVIAWIGVLSTLLTTLVCAWLAWRSWLLTRSVGKELAE